MPQPTRRAGRPKPTETDKLNRRVFGATLRYYRQQRGLTQEQLGWDAQMSPPYIRSLERGTIDPGLRVLLKLSKALGLSLRAFLGEVEDRIIAAHSAIENPPHNVAQPAAAPSGTTASSTTTAPSSTTASSSTAAQSAAHDDGTHDLPERKTEESTPARIRRRSR